MDTHLKSILGFVPSTLKPLYEAHPFLPRFATPSPSSPSAARRLLVSRLSQAVLQRNVALFREKFLHVASSMDEVKRFFEECLGGADAGH